MTTFDTRFAAGAAPQLFSHFGESITYYPFGGTARTITAIVDREPPSIVDGAGEIITHAMVIEVYDSSSTGISLSELNTGRDKIGVALRAGGTAEQRSVAQLMEPQEAGLVRLALN
jgi:hypothetical protein